MAWRRPPPEQTRRATIKIIGGPVYTANEISRSTTDQSRRDTRRFLPRGYAGNIRAIGVVIT